MGLEEIDFDKVKQAAAKAHFYYNDKDFKALDLPFVVLVLMGEIERMQPVYWLAKKREEEK